MALVHRFQNSRETETVKKWMLSQGFTFQEDPFDSSLLMVTPPDNWQVNKSVAHGLCNQGEHWLFTKVRMIPPPGKPKTLILFFMWEKVNDPSVKVYSLLYFPRQKLIKNLIRFAIGALVLVTCILLLV